MPLIIGVDEAGYGPNLGPLVIAASAWRVPSGLWADRTDARSASPEFLRCDCITPINKRANGTDATGGPWIADSKVVYRSGGIAALERTVLAAMMVSHGRLSSDRAEGSRTVGGMAVGAANGGVPAASPLPQSAAAFCRELAGRDAAGWIEDRANKAIDLALPRAATLAEVDRGAANWLRTFDKRPLLGSAISGTSPPVQRSRPSPVEPTGVVVESARPPIELLGLVARPIFPSEFNRLLDHCARKSDLLSRASLELVLRMIERLRGRFGAEESLTIYCDKHGGRNRYSALLSEVAGGSLFATIEESREASRYRGRCDRWSVEWLFLSKAERLVPVALASLTAKYLRELAMESFNRYWTSRVPGLRATAGYPVDARRFLAETEAARRAEAVSLSEFWRNK